MLAIVDYRAGNLTSVRRALDSLEIPCVITGDPKIITAAEGIIFPGVGAAGSAMHHLRQTGLDRVITEAVHQGRPVLGICLGCQIILDHSQENDTPTLGIIPGECIPFSPELKEENGESIRIPHMGWNRVELKQPCRLFDGVAPESEFYFVHTYYTRPEPEYIIGATYYGQEFCSVLGLGNLWAVQFHPEKSGRPGLKILQNFAAYCRETRHAQ
ncbi:MAG: imidazole glycerol phosphate synthase subunit HisH [Desulfoplanes sp.]|nr:imidazole glycerol phosphate synthase subunit HisH [Desulfoplanes sp.]